MLPMFCVWFRSNAASTSSKMYRGAGWNLNHITIEQLKMVGWVGTSASAASLCGCTRGCAHTGGSVGKIMRQDLDQHQRCKPVHAGVQEAVLMQRS
eukprot:1160280-Pelagomonas_calceolata.AAC.6